MEFDANSFKEKSEKYNKSLEAATDEIEQSMNAILEKHGLAGDNLSALQMLTAKAMLKEDEFMGGDMMGHICQNFMTNLDLLLNKYSAKKEVMNKVDKNPELN
jgi:hypothetical protein